MNAMLGLRKSSTSTPDPPRRASPYQPPPLYPISLSGYNTSTPESAQLLSRSLAEEIRLLVPPRLQLQDDWKLVYSLEQNGSSLSTLYEKVDEFRGLRAGFVLIVRDSGGNVFGAYMTDAPRPSAHYFGTGECFLWKASILPPESALLASLPPPPSSDTTNLGRSTTISAERGGSGSKSPAGKVSAAGLSMADRIRFKAFPYSGLNDFLILCDHAFLSLGGGDGHYGLWLDSNFETGISSTCPTFGNEQLSEEGEKFEVMGVEVWYLGA